ncbi:formyltransferase family protein [Prochlorococcus marinus]|uniref:formyltransferase family protein n=1 Tax=Prochlorococcus marinus TaxID=1219 RepID=UPI0022B59FF4|nr:formyltransferase family protein [Prochlorococcus marinus]
MTKIFNLAIKHLIPIFTAKSLQKSQLFHSYSKGSCLYSSGYPLLINESLYSRFKYALNCHPSLLPRNRGRYLEYILINNDYKSGTTIHHIKSGCDNGPIIMQQEYDVSFTDNVSDLLEKSYRLEINMLKDIIQDPLKLEIEIHQDESKATTYTAQRTPQDSELSNETSLLDAYLASRAFDENLYPGYFKYKNYRIYFRMNVVEDSNN